MTTGSGAGALAALLGSLFVSACSTEYLPVALTPDGTLVSVSADAPAPSCVSLGPVEGSHGTQCNAFGRSGTKEGAYAVLRNVAGAHGADYVQVDRELPPDPRHDNCLFTVRGTAFRCR